MSDIGIGFGLRRGHGATSFDPVSLFPGGTSGALYEVRPGYVFQDVDGEVPAGAGDPVGCLVDRSGNGSHAVQAVAGFRPILRQQTGGVWYLEFDGVDDCLAAAFPMVQPWERISSLRQVSWIHGRHVYGGAIINAGVLQQYGQSASLRLANIGGSTLYNIDPILGADQVVLERHDGLSSSLAVDHAAPLAADYGSSPIQGITLGASNEATAFSAIRVYGLLMRAGLLDPDEQALAHGWMAARAGIAI